jgi:hypothetical protein
LSTVWKWIPQIVVYVVNKITITTITIILTTIKTPHYNCFNNKKNQVERRERGET